MTVGEHRNKNWQLCVASNGPLCDRRAIKSRKTTFALPIREPNSLFHHPSLVTTATVAILALLGQNSKFGSFEKHFDPKCSFGFFFALVQSPSFHNFFAWGRGAIGAHILSVQFPLPMNMLLHCTVHSSLHNKATLTWNCAIRRRHGLMYFLLAYAVRYQAS